MELGAGGALPSIVTALNGAQKVCCANASAIAMTNLSYTSSQVVITDYPDAALIENMHTNVKKNVPVDISSRVAVTVSFDFEYGGQLDG